MALKLSPKQTQEAIQKIKLKFSQELAFSLSLDQICAPLFLERSTLLNDGLNGEEPVNFLESKEGKHLEIVHSLAKWKRFMLGRWSYKIGEGIYSNMLAIRQKEVLDYSHSYLVDQWDWEKVIAKNQRNLEFLRETVKQIFQLLKNVEAYVCQEYSFLKPKLPEEIFFINSQELEDLYPDLDPSQREDAIAKEKKAVFIEQIGYKLKSGVVHSPRAFDYDDWELNGDLIVYNPKVDKALEISSMGIRVDKKALIRQSQKTEQELKSASSFYSAIIEENIPFTIGGGIGQSRVFMFFLEKFHIGEVQFSYWPKDTRAKYQKKGYPLL